MKVIWSDFAIKMLKDIHFYYKKKSSISKANKIKREIFSVTKQLYKHPFSGAKELQLKKLNQNHRYLVHHHYKIIYKPISEGYLITDVFDTRQSPYKINNQNR